MGSNTFGIDTDPTASAGDLVLVTPSDSAEIPMTRSLYVGGTGDVAVLTWKGSASVTLQGVPAGSVLPVRVRKVLATGTTATNIIAMY